MNNIFRGIHVPEDEDGRQTTGTEHSKKPYQFTLLWHIFSLVIIIRVALKWPVAECGTVFWAVVVFIFLLSCYPVVTHYRASFPRY